MSGPHLIVREDARAGGGHAVIEVHGLAAVPDSTELAIRRAEHQANNLAAGGWQGPEARITPRESRFENGVLSLGLGPEVVDHLELGTPLEIELPALGLKRSLHWPRVAPSVQASARRRRVVAGERGEASAGGAPPRERPAAASERAAPASARPEVEPRAAAGAAGPATAGPDRGPPGLHRRWMRPVLLGLAALLLLALVGAGVAALLSEPAPPLVAEPDPAPADPAAPDPAAAPESPPGAPAEPGGADAGASADPVALARSYLETQPPHAEAHAFALDLLQRGRADAALLILEYGERAGHGPSLESIGTMYDPVLFSEDRSGFSEPNPRRAVALYRAAERAGHEPAGDSLEALRRWLESRAGAGDAEAQRLLDEEWG